MLGPDGPVHWTVLAAHVLWDGWLHLRDIGSHSSTLVKDDVVVLYSLLIASVPAQFGGVPLDVSVDLTGSDGRHLQAVVAPGHVTVRVTGRWNATTPTRVPTGAEDLHGKLGPVVAALSGREAVLDQVLHGDPGVRGPGGYARSCRQPADAEPPDSDRATRPCRGQGASLACGRAVTN